MKAQTLSKDRLEKEVARENPKAAVSERAKYVSDERVELRLGISEELLKKLRRIQDLESQRSRKAASLEDALEKLAEVYLEKNDPSKKPKEPSPNWSRDSFRTGVASKSQPSPDMVVNLRDQGQCTHAHPDGSRCEQRRWIETHHIRPVSQGGSNSISNLTTLCFHHHRMIHRE